MGATLELFRVETISKIFLTIPLTGTVRHTLTRALGERPQPAAVITQGYRQSGACFAIAMADTDKWPEGHA